MSSRTLDCAALVDGESRMISNSGVPGERIVATLLEGVRQISVPRSLFLRNVLTLAGAATLANAISVLASPLLTRLYSPEQFGLMGTFASAVAILSIIACLRYEIAIPLPEQETVAANLLAMGFAVLSLSTLGVSLAVFLVPSEWLQRLDLGPLGELVWLLPVAVFTAGGTQLLRYWAVRRKEFRTIGWSSLSRNGSLVTTQIGLGSVGIGTAGLLWGVVVSQVIAAGVLLRLCSRGLRDFRHAISLPAMRAAGLSYWRFPVFVTASSFCNTAAIYLPILLLAAYFDPAIAGAFLLCQRVLGLPLRLIGKAICDVFYAECARLMHESPDRLMRLFLRTTVKLSFIGIAIAVAGLAAPWYFDAVFGNQWAEAGRYCQALGLLVAVQFVATSTSNLNTYRTDHWQLGWNLVNLSVTATAIVGPAQFGVTPNQMVLVYSLAGSLVYLLLLLLNYLAIKRLQRERDVSC